MRVCDSCLFGDQCYEPRGCDHYYSTDGSAEEEFSERAARLFVEDWMAYISDDYVSDQLPS